MVKYSFGPDGGSITVEGEDAFYVDADGMHGNRMTRLELTEFRCAIDQALNTSAKELEASEAERERQRYAKVDPARRIENAFVSAGEACGIRDASKAFDA